jgi:hypothetical protein
MFRIEFPVEHWGLLLTPRFAALGVPWQFLTLAVFILIPSLLLLWLYRYEFRLIRRLTAVMLLSLRFVLVVLLWFVICFQPVLGRIESERTRSRILIGLDLSASMGIHDPQRTPLEKLLLARALKIKTATDLPVDELLDSWIKQYEQDGEDSAPAWLSPADSTDPAERAKLAEARQQLHDQLCAEVDLLTRAQIVERILSPSGMDLVHRLGKSHQIEIVVFDESLWDIKHTNLKVTPADQDRGTNLTLPLQRALESAGTSPGKFLGVLLLTDGRHNADPGPETLVHEFKSRQIPIYPVVIGGKKPPPDLAVVRIMAPTNLLLKTPAQLHAEIKVTCLPAQDVIVELHQAGQAKPKEQVLKHQGGDKSSYLVEFPLEFEKLGTHQVTVKVRPASPKVREVTEQNNSQSAVVRVVEDKAQILLIDEEARWEQQYLASALLRDEAMKLDQVLFVQPYVGAVEKSKLKTAGHPALELPTWAKDKKQADPLRKYHCIILGDVPPERLALAERERLARFVAERGGTLVLLAGKHAMPLLYLKQLADDKQPDPLMKLLPVQNLQVIKPKDGFALTLTPEGEQAPYLQIEATAADSSKAWTKFPRHHWAVIGKAKAGATVLAQVKKEETGLPALGATNTNDPKRNNALIAVQQYGLGRVIFVGLDSTWRWRYRTGDLYHHRFWGQLILWAASTQLLPAGNEFVRVGTKQAVYNTEEEVEIVVRLEDVAPELPADAKVQARLLLHKDGGTEELVAVVPLLPDAQGPRLFKGKAKKLPAGKYRIDLDIPDLAEHLKKSASEASAPSDPAGFVILGSESKEMEQLAVDWLLLNNLSQKSGAGPEALTPDRLDDLLKTLESQAVDREQREERRLWQDEPLTWYLLGVLLTLLTVEWTVRKFAALP